MFILYAGLGALVLASVLLGNSLRIIKQYERGIVFRFGRVNSPPRRPGLAFIIPFVERMEKVNLQIITMPVPAQEGITRDNVTVRVDAVIYFKVVDPFKAAVDVEDYNLAVGQVAQTSLRNIIGKSELDDLLTNRERLNEGLEVMIDSPAVDWGVHIDRVEIKDVALPESMKRSMSRQAEAERERRARVIVADAELQASSKLARAAETMADTPAALQLRLLQTVTEVATEKNSTLVLPFPVELMRFLERSTPGGGEKSPARQEMQESGAGSEEDSSRSGPGRPVSLDQRVPSAAGAMNATSTTPEAVAPLASHDQAALAAEEMNPLGPAGQFTSGRSEAQIAPAVAPPPSSEADPRLPA